MTPRQILFTLGLLVATTTAASAQTYRTETEAQQATVLSNLRNSGFPEAQVANIQIGAGPSAEPRTANARDVDAIARRRVNPAVEVASFEARIGAAIIKGKVGVRSFEVGAWREALDLVWIGERNEAAEAQMAEWATTTHAKIAADKRALELKQRAKAAAHELFRKAVAESLTRDDFDVSPADVQIEESLGLGTPGIWNLSFTVKNGQGTAKGMGGVVLGADGKPEHVLNIEYRNVKRFGLRHWWNRKFNGDAARRLSTARRQAGSASGSHQPHSTPHSVQVPTRRVR